MNTRGGRIVRATESDWSPAPNSKVAFIDEYLKMAKYDFDFGGKMINKIMSPGLKLFHQWLI